MAIFFAILLFLLSLFYYFQYCADVASTAVINVMNAKYKGSVTIDNIQFVDSVIRSHSLFPSISHHISLLGLFGGMDEAVEKTMAIVDDIFAILNSGEFN